MSVLLEQHQRWEEARSRLGVLKVAEPVMPRPIPPPPANAPRARPKPWAKRAVMSIVPPVIRDKDTVWLAPTEPTGSVFPSWRKICNEVCQLRKITPGQVLSSQRGHDVVMARHEIMYRLSRETAMSLPQIGRRLMRDHTTVMYGIRKHLERLALGTLVE